MTKTSTLILTLSILLLQSCGGSGGSGNAPSDPTVVPVPTAPVSGGYSVILKNAQAVTTAGGWVVDEDHINIIKKKTLSNGWEIEAQYE
jgi:hypothetical protein